MCCQDILCIYVMYNISCRGISLIWSMQQFMPRAYATQIAWQAKAQQCEAPSPAHATNRMLSRGLHTRTHSLTVHTHTHTHTDIHTHSALTSRLKRMHFRLFTFAFAAIHVSQRLHQIEKRCNSESRLWSQAEAWQVDWCTREKGWWGEGLALLVLAAL